MKLDLKTPPRKFTVGKKSVVISDVAQIKLDPEEQITFITNDGREYDFCAKSWGFYASPSINGRLKNFGFKMALVANEDDKIFILAVSESKMDEFKVYLEDEGLKIIDWLDQS